jgi:hypothetical protein
MTTMHEQEIGLSFMLLSDENHYIDSNVVIYTLKTVLRITQKSRKQ